VDSSQVSPQILGKLVEMLISLGMKLLDSETLDLLMDSQIRNSPEVGVSCENRRIPRSMFLGVSGNIYPLDPLT
jgi:hypothetical protein